ncbi:MAG TPA: valine--tRNA ligase [Acidimicrobiales bacterium]|nr:valine--tRNA ligase [Acidimicrobiales bacterium]
MCPTVPDKPTLEGLEAKWIAHWAEHGTYAFDRTKTRAEIYSVDTPPPTVSGHLHIGHTMSYAHTDLVVRYQRMRGREVFYPMGWDDNGLNLERRTQIEFGVICDPSLPYDPNFVAPDPPPERPVPISRPNFVELCAQLSVELEEEYRQLWTTIGLSVDWSYLYRTINPDVTKVSQTAFLKLLERDEAYRVEAPTLWDVDFKTSLAQADLEDREIAGAYHRIRFSDIEIDTTRPELIPACVALVAHPDDARYKPRFGTTVRTPLFGVEVPILGHELADPEKGTGIAMICTFGDTTDVVWWRELDLPVRSVMGRDGRLVPMGWDDPAAQTAYDELAGKTAKQAQKRIVELLRDSGELVGDPKPITHAVKFWENGDRPLEIITTRQWFIRFPSKDVLLERGRELRWHPEFMQVRYENWVNGLTGDWNITRQRFFGVPFPVWYPVDAEGQVDWNAPIAATPETLPADPSTDVPPGFADDQRGQPGGFVGDPDVMDTWATSSMSPEFVSGWHRDEELFGLVFPMNLRPQGQDIIRTWLFYSIVRAELEFHTLPFSDAAISGFVNDPDRKKLSKSLSNSQDDPFVVIANNGADALRYWAAQGRPGRDLEVDRNQFKIGRRLATKVLNASRFVLSFASVDGGDVTAPIDRSMLAGLSQLISQATAAFEDYDYTRALDHIESFFWSFCDDYLELIKGRAYGDDAASAHAALTTALSVLLRLLAPFLPYVTEEVWSWWQEGSIHRSSWPSPLTVDGDPAVLAAAAEVLGQVRKAKTTAQKSMRAPVASLRVTGPAEFLAALAQAEGDVREAAGLTGTLETVDGTEVSVDVELAD